MLLIGKAAEFEAFVAGVALIRTTLPALEPCLQPTRSMAHGRSCMLLTSLQAEILP
jgi:hypothetical protein